MKYAIVDKTMDINMKKALSKHGYIIIDTVICKNVQKSLEYHPDIQLCRIDQKTIVVEPSCFLYYKDLFNHTDIEVIKGEAELKGNYPYDIAYNVLVSESYAVHKFKYTDKVVLEELSKRDIKLIDINQGYSKCAIAILPNDKVITEDEGIADILSRSNIEVLKISKGEVNLLGYNYGFIGGSSSQGADSIFFSGSLSKHSYSDYIKNYISDVNTIELSNKTLYDYGSIIILG